MLLWSWKCGVVFDKYSPELSTLYRALYSREQPPRQQSPTVNVKENLNSLSGHFRSGAIPLQEMLPHTFFSIDLSLITVFASQIVWFELYEKLSSNSQQQPSLFAYSPAFHQQLRFFGHTPADSLAPKKTRDTLFIPIPKL